MSTNIQRHTNFDLTLQIAFVATVTSLILAISLSILAAALPNHLFNPGALSILITYKDGTPNQQLLLGLATVASFFIIFLIPSAITHNSLTWSRRLTYIWSAILTVALITWDIIIPYLNGNIPALQTNYYPTILTLTTITAYLICAQPAIAQRADRKKTKPHKTTQDTQ